MNTLVNKVVLIVDDEERNRFALKSYLESYDIRIEIATNGEEAIDMIRKGVKVDIILLDMMMPVMDGYETLAELKNDEALSAIPVIAVTAKAMKGDAEKCIESGAWDYISKPVNLGLLLEKINQWVS